jgi:hypothetical protein
MNNHPGYLEAPLPALARRLRRPAVLFDAWSLLDPAAFRDVSGLHYAALGSQFSES